jgi:hypothetical protein
MRRLSGALLLAALSPVPGLAITSPANSTIPHHIVLVAIDQGQPDAAVGEFVIVARDFANVPDEDKLIEVRFQNCSGARVAADQLQASVTSKCATHGITAITGLDGSVHMIAVGGGDPHAPHGAGPCAGIYSDGVLLGLVPVAYLDLDGSEGLGAGDLSVWLSDFVTGEPIGRSDFDGDGSLGALDLSFWLTAWSGGRQTKSGAPYCP